jgi:hypothetical protein
MHLRAVHGLRHVVGSPAATDAVTAVPTTAAAPPAAGTVAAAPAAWVTAAAAAAPWVSAAAPAMPVVLDASTVGAHLLLLVICNVIKYATMLIWRSIHRSKNKKTMELTSLLRGRGGEEDSGRQEDSEHEESLGGRHCRSVDLELAGVGVRMFCLGVERVSGVWSYL